MYCSSHRERYPVQCAEQLLGNFWPLRNNVTTSVIHVTSLYLLPPSLKCKSCVSLPCRAVNYTEMVAFMKSKSMQFLNGYVYMHLKNSIWCYTELGSNRHVWNPHMKYVIPLEKTRDKTSFQKNTHVRLAVVLACFV